VEKKWARGEGESSPTLTPPLHPLPVKHPVTIQDGGIQPIYLAFRSETAPVLQVNSAIASLLCKQAPGCNTKDSANSVRCKAIDKENRINTELSQKVDSRPSLREICGCYSSFKNHRCTTNTLKFPRLMNEKLLTISACYSKSSFQKLEKKLERRGWHPPSPLYVLGLINLIN